LVSEKREGFALRPEGTASIVRSYIENGLDRKEPLSKFFYIGPMFRGERPQKGRLRQFHQIGAEVLGPGSSSPFLDADVVALGARLLRAFGVKEFKLKINSLGDPQDKERFAETLRRRFAPLIGAFCEDCRRRFDQNVFRILDCKRSTCRELVADQSVTTDHLSPSSRDYFEGVKKALVRKGIAFDEDPLLVRGLDYYTHTVFEFSVSSLGSQDAVGAGGRYNGLVAQLGGPSVEAMGFALGMERILLAMDKAVVPPAEGLRVCVVPMNEQALIKAEELVDQWRQAGVSSEMIYRVMPMKKMMRQAHRHGARYAVILGEEEMASGRAMVKDMREGTQQTYPLVSIVREVMDKDSDQ